MLAGDRGRQLAGEEPGNRDRTGLMRLRSTEDDLAADVGEGSPDVDAAAGQVDVADSQGCCLAPAQSRVAEQQDEHMPWPGLRREVLELVVGQEHVVAASGPGQAEPVRWVGADATASHGVIERSTWCRR